MYMCMHIHFYVYISATAPAQKNLPPETADTPSQPPIYTTWPLRPLPTDRSEMEKFAKDGYLEKQAFLQRTDARQAEVARSNRRRGMGLKDWGWGWQRRDDRYGRSIIRQATTPQLVGVVVGGGAS